MKNLSKIETLIDKLKTNSISTDEAAQKLQSFLNSSRHSNQNATLPPKPINTAREKSVQLQSIQSITPLSEKQDAVPDFPIDRKFQCSTSSSLQLQAETDLKFQQQLMDTNSKMKLQIKKKLKKASDKKQDYNFDCLDFLDSQSLFEEYCRYQNKRTSNKDSALAESENLEFSPFDLLNLKQQVAKLQKKPIPKTKPLSTLNKKISSPTTNEKSKQRQKITSGSRIASTQKTSFREEKTQSKLLQPKVQTLQRKNSTVEYSVNTQCQTVSNFSPTASSIKSSKRPRDLRVYESKQLSSPFSDKQDNKSPVHFSQDFPIVEVYELDIDSGDDKALNEQKSSVERSKENLSSIQIKKKLDRKELNKKSKILISNRKSSKGSVYQEQRKKPYVMSLCPVLGKKKNDQTPAKKVLKGSTQTNVSPFKCDKKRGLEELEKKQKQLGIYSSRNGDPSNSLAAKLSINNIQRQLTTSRTKNSVQSNFEAYQSNAERGIKSPPQLRKKVPLSFDLSNSRRIDSMKSISNEISSDIKVKKRSIKEMDLRQVAQLACQKAKKKVELLEDVENYLSSQENLRFDGQKSKQ